jgi:hypothetical protein
VTSVASAALGLVMRKGLVVAVFLATAACGAYQFPGGSSGGTGSVLGRVVAVPCAPVEQAGKPCAGRPVAGLEIEYSKGDATAKAVTGSDGQYSVRLSAGTWTVQLKTNLRVISGPAEVKVSDGSTVTANYTLDSGIRVPVPQK